jgi:hypothetical protein
MITRWPSHVKIDSPPGLNNKLSFGTVPLAARAVLGSSAVVLVTGAAAGGVVMMAGLWRFRGPLRLAAMPGVSFVRARRAAA